MGPRAASGQRHAAACGMPTRPLACLPTCQAGPLPWHAPQRCGRTQLPIPSTPHPHHAIPLLPALPRPATSRQESGPLLPLYLWAFLLLLSLLIMTVYPLAIAPVFNKYEPLPQVRGWRGGGGGPQPPGRQAWAGGHVGRGCLCCVGFGEDGRGPLWVYGKGGGAQQGGKSSGQGGAEVGLGGAGHGPTLATGDVWQDSKHCEHTQQCVLQHNTTTAAQRLQRHNDCPRVRRRLCPGRPLVS